MESTISLRSIFHNLNLNAMSNAALPHMSKRCEPLDTKHAEAA
jgi:hypothetical protein